jgi:two-component system, NtrC family, sensor histidine kinase HydH
MAMTIRQWISIVAAIGELALAAFALVHSRPSALKAPFALLCLDVSAWTAASPAYLAHPTLTLGIDRALSPLTAPLALDFVLVFVGIRRSSYLVRTASFVLCGALSLTSLVAFGVPDWRPFLGSHTWQVWLLGSSLPTMAVAVITLTRHYHQSADGQERARASLLLLALGAGTVFGITDSIGDFAPWCPHLADFGMLVGAVGMAIVTVRFRLFGRETSRRIMVALGAAATATLYTCAVALSVAGTRAVAIILVTLAIGIACVAGARERMITAAMRTERTAQLATLGRFSAQMDHDVRNPLAALKGAAQLLRRDLTRPEPVINRLDFANLIVDQVGRIEAIFDRYRRLSRLELDRSMIQVNDVVLSVLSRQASGLPDEIEVRSDLASNLPACLADADLLATIVENLARNAVDAMPGGGTLTVRTRAGVAARAGIELVVEDTGVGMDARTRERATDDFFTTKPAGSGFGLAFTKRVVEAHGGRLTIASQVGFGTLVRLWIPAQVG